MVPDRSFDFEIRVPDPEGRVPDRSLGCELCVPDPEERVPGISFGFDLSVPDPEGRVLCSTLAGSEGDPCSGLLLVVDSSYHEE